MKYWTSIGPEWKTEDIFRIREILKGEHIPFRMPYSDVFFMNYFNVPSKDRRWSILVRKKDWDKTVDLLVREGLASWALWEVSDEEPCPAGSPELAPRILAPIPSR